MAAPLLNIRRHPVAGLVYIAVFLVAAMLYARAASDRIDELLHGPRLVRTDFDLNNATFEVTFLAPGARTELRLGDKVLAVNGHPARGWSDVFLPLRSAKPGDSLTLHVRRTENQSTIEKDVADPLLPFTYVGYLPGTAGYVETILSRILTPLLCLALGFWVVAVRINDRSAWALLAMMLGTAFFIGDSRTFFGYGDAFEPFLTGMTAPSHKLDLQPSFTSVSSSQPLCRSIASSQS